MRSSELIFLTAEGRVIYRILLIDGSGLLHGLLRRSREIDGGLLSRECVAENDVSLFAVIYPLDFKTKGPIIDDVSVPPHDS